MGYNIEVMNGLNFQYDGLYEFRKIYPFLSNLFEEKLNYDVTIEKSEEEIKDDGEKYFFIKFKIESEYNDYLSSMTKFILKLSGYEEMVELNGVKKNLINGRVDLLLGKSIISKEGHSRKKRTAFTIFLDDINAHYFKKSEIGDFKNILKKDWEKSKVELQKYFSIYENMLGGEK